MSITYSNYRWEKPGRKGDWYYYKRDVSWSYNPTRKPEEQVIATVTYDADSKSPHWGKWHITIPPGAQSPELNALRKSDIPKFSSKDDAMAWTTAMVRLSV
jgi:hypothetical protein